MPRAVQLLAVWPASIASVAPRTLIWTGLADSAFGTFQRSITLPMDVDGGRAEATSENGILRLRLPKAESAKPVQIKVRGATEAIEAGQTANN